MEWLNFREPVSAWTHCAWLFLSLPAGLMLWRHSRGSGIKRFSFLVFSLSLALCYGGSTLYHGVRLPREQIEVFAALDHVGIYLLIAGSITPVAMIVLQGRWQQVTLALAWLLAAGGIVLCLASEVPPTVSTGLYLGMGWGIVLCYFVLARALSHRAMRVAVLGGVLYSVGAILNLLHWPVLYPGVVEAHEVFHLFVMGGSLAHFWFMLTIVAPYVPLPAEPLSEVAANPVPAPRLNDPSVAG